MITLGEQMRKVREEKGYTRQRLANKANISFHSIVSWEKDRAVPNVLSVIDLAKALGVTVDEYLGVTSVTAM